MARHSSPPGAQTEDLDRTVRIPVVRAGGSHRLPAPPSGSRRGRITVLAVAAGQTALSALLPAQAATPALVPVDTVAHESDLGAPAASYALTAIGGDQLLPDPTALGPGPTAASLDIKNLTKATAIGEQIARSTRTIDSALSDGASEAHLYGGDAFVRPALGRFTSGFGARWGAQHLGIDIANRIGTPIYAFTDGTVEQAGPASGFGLWVVLRHPDGTRSVYGHINRMFVHKGQTVTAGEQIAEIGNRGHSTGPHLHFEIWDRSGAKVNPQPWLKKHGINITGSGSSSPAEQVLPRVDPTPSSPAATPAPDDPPTAPLPVVELGRPSTPPTTVAPPTVDPDRSPTVSPQPPTVPGEAGEIATLG